MLLYGALKYRHGEQERKEGRLTAHVCGAPTVGPAMLGVPLRIWSLGFHKAGSGNLALRSPCRSEHCALQ